MEIFQLSCFVEWEFVDNLISDGRDDKPQSSGVIEYSSLSTFRYSPMQQRECERCTQSEHTLDRCPLASLMLHSEHDKLLWFPMATSSGYSIQR